MSFCESHSHRRSRLSDSERTRLSITPDRRKTLVFFPKSQETCPLRAVLRVQGRRPQCSSRQCKSPPVIVFLLKCRSVVAQCHELPHHFNSAVVRNFNAAVSFPSGACGSLGTVMPGHDRASPCHSVASPPRRRPWRLSPRVVLCIISMIVFVILYLFPLNTDSLSCPLSYYVIVL